MKSNELLKLLISKGWKIARQSGSHIILKPTNITEFIVFPNHGSKEVGKGLEMKIKKIAKIK